MTESQTYRAAAIMLGKYGAAYIAEALVLLQQIPNAGPIFAQIEKADEMLCHATQALYAKADAAGECHCGDRLCVSCQRRAAAMMELALPESIRRRLAWRPPGEPPTI